MSALNDFMSIQSRILKNISFVSAGELISNFLSYFLIIFIARLLGSEGLGIYSFAFAFVGLFAVFNDFGLSTFFVREVSKKREDIEKYFGNYAAMRLILCIISAVLPLVFILFLKRSSYVVGVVYLAAVALFFQNYSYIPRNTFLAYQVMQYDSAIKIIERIVAFTLGLYVLWAGYGLLAFLIVLAISNFIAYIMSVIFLRKINIKFRFKIDYKIWKSMLKTSWPFWLSMIFLQIYFQLDTVMLSFMKGYEATGLYNAAYKLIFVADKIPLIIGLVLFPVMSELYASMSKGLLKKTLQKGSHLMIILSLPLISGTVILADRIILFIYKSDFKGSIIALQILIWTTFFMFLSYLIGWFLNATNRQKIFTYTTGLCLAFNVILNFMLIPSFGYTGASIATLVTAALNFLLLYHFSIKSGYFVNIFKLILKPLIAAILMGALIIFFGKDIHLLALIPVSALFYFLLLILMKDVKKTDFEDFISKKSFK